MKILYISNSTLPSKAANSFQVMQMAAAFSELGHQVTLVAIASSEQSSENDIFAYYGIKNSFSIRMQAKKKIPAVSVNYGFSLVDIIRRISPDLVYGRFPLGCLIAKLLGYRSVLELHSVPSKSLLQRGAAKFFAKLPGAKLVSISEALTVDLSAWSSMRKSEILTAHDGASAVIAKNSRIKNIKLRNKKLHIGYIGSLYPGKGAEFVVEIARQMPQNVFHIAGAGTLNALNSLPRNVIFYGYLKPEMAFDLRNRCDILLAPYLNRVSSAGGENIVKWMSPLKIFEYMASSKPIVASKLPVLEEVLEHGRNALLCLPGDIVEWKSALEKLANDDLREWLASEALKDFLLKYTWERRAEKILSFAFEKS